MSMQMTTRLSAILLLMVASAPALSAPGHSPWPGGIGVIRIPGDSRPTVLIDKKPALVMAYDGGWVAVIGVPLEQDGTSPLIATVERPGAEAENVAIDLREANYRVQRLSVDRKYVEPDQASLDRIFAERKIIDNALTGWRKTELTDIMLEAPVPGARSSSFGSRRIFNDQPRSPHKGMDITANTGTPILAPLGGVVSATGNFYFNGNTVIVDHGQGFISLYCHLSAIDVAAGQEVAVGELLGKVGATGRVTGAHLHFATYLNGTAVDPALLLATD
jgi:murein DD-endopeptidase MepM/ murein hydrolase activator NlpD